MRLAALLVADGGIGQDLARNWWSASMNLAEIAQFLSPMASAVFALVGQVEQGLGVGDGQGRLVIVPVALVISFVRPID